jgi:hypothetical protein
MPLVNSNRQGAKDVNPKKAMQHQIALEYLQAVDAHGAAVNQSTDYRRLINAREKVESVKQHLLHYHDGDMAAANQTLDEVDALRIKGKKQ